VSACTNPYDPGQRTVGGGLLGAGTGAAVGALAGGGRGAAIGAVAGGVLGAAGGAATTPHVRSPGYDEGPPPGYYEQPPPPLATTSGATPTLRHRTTTDSYAFR